MLRRGWTRSETYSKSGRKTPGNGVKVAGSGLYNPIAMTLVAGIKSGQHGMLYDMVDMTKDIKSSILNMNAAEQIQWLVKYVGNHIKVRRKVPGLWRIFGKWSSNGWLSLDDKGDYWAVLWTSNRHVHNPLAGSAFGVDVNKADGLRVRGSLDLTGAWKSAISMWPIRNEEDAKVVYVKLLAMINESYEFYVAR